MHDTEDKGYWVEEGRRREDLFVDLFSNSPVGLSLNAKINPEKETNPYVPDLIVEGRLSDLKNERTPFFLAEKLYGIDSQYAFAFNGKDYERYSKLYPELMIYIWLEWTSTAYRRAGEVVGEVVPMSGIWRTTFSQMAGMIESGRVPLHSYKNRTDDKKGNAKNSYIFDARWFECLYLAFPASVFN